MPGLPPSLPPEQVAGIAFALTTLVASFRLAAGPATDWVGSMHHRYGVPGRLFALVSVGVGAWAVVGTVAWGLGAFEWTPWRPLDGYTLAAVAVPLALWGTGQVLRGDRARTEVRT
ncbi:hypothetical protein [Halomarina rubra]|uniref:Uncharacterized protein n=1 Tax=Halomarina rubra TaxID=2071873 RepID=A0ABD6AW10_9EURY|nr:hypothetical protein [Halomarina rubra]